MKWDNAIVGLWEIVETMKDLSLVPRLLDGSFYRAHKSGQEKIAERERYIQAIKHGESARQLDSRFSETLDDSNTQNLAQAIWLYLDGKIGYYSDMFDPFTEIYTGSSD
jgi:hypothetical protein